MPLPAAASASVARVLTGPVRTVTVTAALPSALYLSTLDAATPAICLAGADAIRVPCALVLGAGVAIPLAPVGTPAWLGDGQLRLGRSAPTVVVARWWRPPRPRLEPLPSATVDRALSTIVVAVADFYAVHRTTVDLELTAPAAALTAPAAALTDPAAALTEPAAILTEPAAILTEPAAALTRALASAAPEALAESVGALLGRGPGLTPLGDDVLAGALVTLTATGHPMAAPLAGSVAGALAARPGRATTVVSAALLAHAVLGECVPALAGVLAAVAGTNAATLVSAVTELLRVGHSSGGGLLLGVRIGLEARSAE